MTLFLFLVALNFSFAGLAVYAIKNKILPKQFGAIQRADLLMISIAWTALSIFLSLFILFDALEAEKNPPLLDRLMSCLNMVLVLVPAGLSIIYFLIYLMSSLMRPKRNISAALDLNPHSQ